MKPSDSVHIERQGPPLALGGTLEHSLRKGSELSYLITEKGNIFQDKKKLIIHVTFKKEGELLYVLSVLCLPVPQTSEFFGEKDYLTLCNFRLPGVPKTIVCFFWNSD